MLKIRSIKPGIPLVLTALFICGNLLALSIIVNPKISSAQQQLSTADIQKNAEEFCKSGKDIEKSACRNGYRAGYNGVSISAECNDRANYTDEQKQSCRSGYGEGKRVATSAGPDGKGVDQCGKGGAVVTTKFNFGCLGKDSPQDISPIEDFLYAIIRFLSVGVGLAVVIAIIVSGIQYSTSEGNPEATQAAKSRIQSAVIALFIYLFIFAIVQFLVPGGVFAGSIIVPGDVPDIIRIIL